MLEARPVIRYPFDLEQLPENGVYFFYEQGEVWGHRGDRPRIVRVGTHRDGNFRSRIADHYLLDERRTHFNATKPAPKDRSIFRKNLGRAWIRKQGLNYLAIWNLDFTFRTNRVLHGHLRDISLEQEIEAQITEILRSSFTFRFIPVEKETDRMGGTGLESRLIGTLVCCSSCKPSAAWLGSFHPDARIRESGLWQVQHLRSPPLSKHDRQRLRALVSS